MDKLDLGEIVYCDITYKYNRLFRNRIKTEVITLNNVVFGREYDSSYPYLNYNLYQRDINKINKKKPLSCDVEVIDLHVHARTGFKHKNKTYTKVKKNEEIRSKSSGAYQ